MPSTTASSTTPTGPSVLSNATGGGGLAAIKALGAVVAVLAFNVAVQLFVISRIRDGQVSLTTGLAIELIGGAMFYAVTGALIFGNLPWIGIQPVLTRGNRLESIAAGACRGGLVSLIIVALSNGVHSGAVDPTTALLASRGAYGFLIVSTVLIVVAAPFIEELVFRGVLAESLRRYGIGTAMTISAALFAVAHVHPGVAVPSLAAYLLYYFCAGRMLGRVYFKRGLIGSIAAHAAFNGTLVAATIVTLLGGAHTVTAGGVTATVPGGWHQAIAPPNEDLALAGPEGAVLEIAHRDYPNGAPPVGWFSAMLVDSSSTGAPIAVAPSTVEQVTLPMGEAVEGRGTHGRLQVHVLVVPHDNRAWVIVIQSVDQTGDDAAMNIVNQLKLSTVG